MIIRELAAPRPIPGPRATASNLSSTFEISETFRYGKVMISGGNLRCKVRFNSLATAQVTSPAPLRMAADAVKTAAPSMGAEPATTSTWPKSYLFTLGLARNNGLGNGIRFGMGNGKKDMAVKIVLGIVTHRLAGGIIINIQIKPCDPGVP